MRLRENQEISQLQLNVIEQKVYDQFLQELSHTKCSVNKLTIEETSYKGVDSNARI